MRLISCTHIKWLPISGKASKELSMGQSALPGMCVSGTAALAQDLVSQHAHTELFDWCVSPMERSLQCEGGMSCTRQIHCCSEATHGERLSIFWLRPVLIALHLIVQAGLLNIPPPCLDQLPAPRTAISAQQCLLGHTLATVCKQKAIAAHKSNTLFGIRQQYASSTACI